MKFIQRKDTNVHIGFLIQKYYERVWHVERYLKMYFFKRREKSSRLLKKYAKIGIFFIYTDRFQVIHVRCHVRMYLVFVFPKGQYESKLK